jgi:hypothetical protein
MIVKKSRAYRAKMYRRQKYNQAIISLWQNRISKFLACSHQVRIPHLFSFSSSALSSFPSSNTIRHHPSKIFFARSAAALSGPPTADLFIAAAYAFAFASLTSSSSDCSSTSTIASAGTSLASSPVFSSSASSSEDEVSTSETLAECFADSDSRSRRVSLPRLRQYQNTKRRTVGGDLLVR